MQVQYSRNASPTGPPQQLGRVAVSAQDLLKAPSSRAAVRAHPELPRLAVRAAGA